MKWMEMRLGVFTEEMAGEEDMVDQEVEEMEEGVGLVEEGIMAVGTETKMATLIWMEAEVETEAVGEDEEIKMAMSIRMVVAIENQEAGEAEDADEKIKMATSTWMVVDAGAAAAVAEKDEENPEEVVA